MDFVGFYPAKEMVPHVWVGSKADAHNGAFFRRHNIRHVINCSKDISFKFPNVNGFRIGVNDDPSENAAMARNLPIAVAAIESAVGLGGNDGVLVHCYAGMQRSATVVAALLMKRHGWTPGHAMRYMQSMKPETFRPYPTFDRALDQFYRDHVVVK